MFKLNFNDRIVTIIDQFGNEIDEYKVEHGSVITVPTTPTRTGYDFYMWLMRMMNSLISANR